MPTITSPDGFRAVIPAYSPASRVTSPNGNCTPTSVSVAGKKFMEGEPMKPATNRFAGVS
ncbi:Uncharacterised protein [Mycobacteroides abscessus subsp. abscessus]|nr:Uncharacterised protein [Mycobacteroides abscessus subsp. abscessus]